MAKKHQVNVRTAASRLLVGDATKALVAAPGAGLRLRIFRVIASIVTAAAQQVDVGHDGGGVAKQLFSIPASGTFPTTFDSDAGFTLDENTALSAKPAAAGPAVQFYIEYVIEQVQA